jgi:hypothetical protein
MLETHRCGELEDGGSEDLLALTWLILKSVRDYSFIKRYARGSPSLH